MPDITLDGCTSRPLAGYLKALGVLRLVASQRDPEARGRWTAGVFELRSELDGAELERFLLEDYGPTPVVSPWNGGSGFHPKDVEPGKTLRTIEDGAGARFEALRRAIAGSRDALARLGLSSKPDKQAKPQLLRELRASLGDAALEWLDCAVIITGEDAAFPPLLGSGGNDARYEFSANFLGALVRLFDKDGVPQPAAAEQLAAALGRSSAALNRAGGSHIVRDGSPTSSASGAGDNLANPWELVLAIEGALVLTAGAARRHAAALGETVSAPFTTAASAAGYGTAVGGEAGRGELWLPIWHGWATHREIANLAREARMAVGRRPVRSGLDAARAASTLGVARGISAFERVALLERAGQSGLAVSAGRVAVGDVPRTRLLDRIDGWLGAVLRLAREGTATQRLAAASLERAAFAFTTSPSPATTQTLVVCLASAERAVALAGADAPKGLRPVSLGRGAEWLAAADDGSPEVAVAAAIAALHQGPKQPAVRDHLLGTGPDKNGRRSYGHATSGVPARASADQRLGRLQIRRFLDARRHDEPLAATSSLHAPLDALRAVAGGEADLERIVTLASGFALADWRDGALVNGVTSHAPVPALELLLLAWHGAPIAEEIAGPRPEWPALLLAGRVRQVLAQAHLGLRQAGLATIVTVDDLCVAAPPGPRLLAATLAPPRWADLHDIRRRLTTADHPSEETAA